MEKRDCDFYSDTKEIDSWIHDGEENVENGCGW